jgi:protein-disulfide isomerase
MNRYIVDSVATLLAMVLFFGSSTAIADSITEDQGTAILEELRQIRQLLERQGAQSLNRTNTPTGKAILKSGANPSLGRETAPVVLVEFTDFECPYCKKFHDTTFPELKRKYIDTGYVRYVSRDLPLPIHQHALKAAQAARCAGEQNNYWQAREVLFSISPNLNREAIPKALENLPLDQEKLRSCLESGKFVDDIRQDSSDAESIGVQGTPGFILGTKEGSEGVRISGAQPFAVFDRELKLMLDSDLNQK